AQRTTELSRQNETLLAVAHAAETLFSAGTWEEAIQSVLAHLGTALGADRVSVFESRRRHDGAWVASWRAGWQREGTAGLHGEALADQPFAESGFGRWLEILPRGESIAARLEDLPPSERGPLRAQGVRALAVVPVRVAGTWWGFLGIDDCRTPRRWSSGELLSIQI